MAKAASKFHSTAHPFWSGTIAFGLVSVPVQLFPANRNTRPRVRLVDQDGTPIQRRYMCPKHQYDVHREHLIRGFEVSPEKYVVVHEDELERLEPKKSREIDLRQFVERKEISPALFERSYYLTPGGESTKAYHLLAAVIEQSDLVGIATFVMRDREYLVAILSENGILQAETLRFHDELRRPSDIGPPKKGKRDAKTVAAFELAIRKHTSNEVDVEEMQDEYAVELRSLVNRKFKRDEDVVNIKELEADQQDVEDDDSEAPDLLETIRRSLHGGNGRSEK